MAPNYVYSLPNFPWQKETQSWSTEVEKSCEKNPMVCLDSINRGLLSGLQTPVTSETVFQNEDAFFKAYSKMVPKVAIPDYKAVLVNSSVVTVTFIVDNLRKYTLGAGDSLPISKPHTSVSVEASENGGKIVRLATSLNKQVTISGFLYLKSESKVEDDNEQTEYTVGSFNL